MIICPLMSNPDVARDFNELKDATSSRAAYNIWSLNNGNMIDKAPNGEPSILFDALLSKFKNRVRAIRQKAKYYTKSFFETFGDWINNPQEVASHLDKNGEPTIIGYNREDIDRFIDKLIPRQRVFVSRKNNINFISHIVDFYNDLLGIRINAKDFVLYKSEINGVIEEDYVKTIDQLKDWIENNIFNDLEKNLDLEIQRLSEIKQDLDKFEFDNIKLIEKRLVEFLDSKNDISEYDPSFQALIKDLFPKLFNTRYNNGQIRGWYKHLILSKNPTERNAVIEKGRIAARLHKRNLQKYKINARLKKLTTVQQAIQTYPNLKKRIKKRLFNEIDLTKNENVLPSGVINDAKIENTKGSHGVYSISAGRLENGKVYSGIQIAQELQKDKRYSEIAKVIERVLKSIGDVPVIPSDKKYVTFPVKNQDDGYYKMMSEERDYAGVYRLGYHLIDINTDNASTYSRRPEEVLIHELVHAASSLLLNSNKELYDSIQQYINYCVQFNSSNLATREDIYSIYGVEDPHEFIAEYFSNPEFQEYLKHIPAMDEKKFQSIFHEILDIILKAIGIREDTNAYDQIRPILAGVFDLQQATISAPVSNLSVLEEENQLYFQKEIIPIETNAKYLPIDTELEQESLNITGDINSYVTKKIIEECTNGSTKDIWDIIQDARKEWVENRQKEILGDTQQKLAAAYGLHKEVGEDGRIRYVSDEKDEKHNLIVDFVNYISTEDKGFYDYDSKSSAAHHIIEISLTEGDPSTFNHELAHHYVKMFWNSKLIQTALLAVYQNGMTDEEVEEALVELITDKTTDAQFLSNIESNSFIQKFWGAFATMLYGTFHIKFAFIRDAVLKNASRAFFVNEQQRVINANKLLFNMSRNRMFQKKGFIKKMLSKVTPSKTYKQRIDALRMNRQSSEVFSQYKPGKGNPLNNSIGIIVQGIISRSKEYRKANVKNDILVQMQLQEQSVKQFVDDINEYREAERVRLGMSEREAFKHSERLTETEEERKANLKLIEDFLETAMIELAEVASKLVSAEKNQFAAYAYREISSGSGDTSVEYLNERIQDLLGDDTVVKEELTFDELVQMYQNIIGFYERALTDLQASVQSGSFRKEYGEDTQQRLLDIMSSDSVIPAITAIKNKYNEGLRERLRDFVTGKIQQAMEGQPQDLIERAKFSLYQWLDNQNVWGDVNALSSWLIMPSMNKSLLVRLIQDSVDTIFQEVNMETEEKAVALRGLREKAVRASRGYFAKKLVKAYGVLSPYNFDKLFIEKNKHGKPTGNFLSEINKGSYYDNLYEITDKLLYGRDGYERKVQRRLNDSSYELELTEDGEVVFPEECEDLRKEYLHKINEWKSHNCVRPFTAKYYEMQIKMLSQKTILAQNKINREINKITKACTTNGRVHTELLSPSKMRKLEILYNEKQQLSNIYDKYGVEKPVGSDERQIADELTAWNEWLGNNIVHKKDVEAYEASKEAAKDKDWFEKHNSRSIINPKIWEEVKTLFPDEEDPRLHKLRSLRSKLRNVITRAGKFPRIGEVWDEEAKDIRKGYEEFWKNLKDLDEQIDTIIWQKKLEDGKTEGSEEYHNYLDKSPVRKLIPGSDIAKSWYQYIEELVEDRIKAENPNDPRLQEKVRQEMLKYQSVTRDEKGDPVSIQPLSIFSYTEPVADLLKLKDKTIVEAYIREPIPIYSKIDKENSNPEYVDSRYNFNSDDYTQPITDDTVQDKENDVSYTNKDYITHVKNAPEEVKIYYEALIKTMKESFDMIPFVDKYDGRLVQKGSTFRQRLQTSLSFRKAIGYKIKRSFVLNEADTDINIDYQLRPDGSRSLNIPARFIKRLSRPDQINTDILGCVIDFYEMACNFKHKSKELSKVQAILHQVNSRKTQDNSRDRLGKSIQGILNRQFYGKSRVIEFGEDNNVSYAQKYQKFLLKFLPALKCLTTTGLLAMNWISAGVAWLDPMLQVLTEALTGKGYDMGLYLKSLLYAIRNIPAALRSTGSTRASGWFGSDATGGMTHFGLIPAAQKFSDMDYSQGLIRFIKQGIVMRPFSIGEYIVNMQTYEIVMSKYKAFTDLKTGKLRYMTKREYLQHAYDNGISLKTARFNWHKNLNDLHSAFGIEDGMFVKKNNEFGKAVSHEFEVDLGKEMRHFSTHANYIVPSTERTLLQTQLFVTFVSVMRTFLFVGIGERAISLRDFQVNNDELTPLNMQTTKRDKLKEMYFADKGGWSFQTRDIIDGVWTGFFRAFRNMQYYKYFLWRLCHFYKSSIDDEVKQKKESLEISNTDLYGANRVISEIGIFAVLVVAHILVHNKMMDDGNDDDYGWLLADHLLMRLAIVRMTFMSPDTVMDLISSVTASYTDIQNKMEITDLLSEVIQGYSEYGWDFDKWDKVTGQSAYKGKPKAFRSLAKTLSFTGMHAILSASNEEGIKAKTKWYKRMLYWSNYLHQKEKTTSSSVTKKRTQRKKKRNKNPLLDD